ncbi:MAG: TonB-dependent receptor [Bacteroidales bacterium]|nr:TonB-dependent receptor [Bacteroidales bacterium]
MMKKIMKTKTILLAGAAVLPLAPAVAQQADKDSTLNRTVVVENQYNPEVMDAFKVNVLPKVEEPQVAKTHIDYATSLRPLGAWQGGVMPPIAGEEERPDAPRGYVRAAYGNRNNTDFRLGYLWNPSERDRLGVTGSFYGRSGHTPGFFEGEEWNSRFFRGDVSLDYRHDFSRVSLNVGGGGGVQNFNYMPFFPEAGSDSQRFQSAQGYVGVSSREGQCPVDFALQTGVQFFGIQHDQYQLAPSSETKVHTQGFMAAPLAEGQRVGIGLTLDNLFYSEKEKEGARTDGESRLTNYSLLQLNPYYTYENGGLRARLGAHVDAQLGHDGGLKVAPDVALDYTFLTSFTLYLQAGGGTTLNDYRRLNELSPYYLTLFQPLVTYAPINLEAGLKASPATGWDFRLFGGYQLLKDELALAGQDILVGQTGARTASRSVYMGQAKAKAPFGGAELNGSFKGWFDVSFKGTYYSWSTDEGDEALLWLKPKFVVDAALRARILSDLHAGITYRYEGRDDSLEGAMAKPGNVSLLCLNADYQLFQRLNVFVQLNNLLDKDYITAQGYPTQGFHALAGISCRF